MLTGESVSVTKTTEAVSERATVGDRKGMAFFASITAAVKEGRTVYNNIEKALLFMLPTNVAQALVILAAILAMPFHSANIPGSSGRSRVLPSRGGGEAGHPAGPEGGHVHSRGRP